MRMVCEQEQSGHHHHGHMHHHGGGHHHHGNLRHGHVVGHIDHLLGADDQGQEMVNIGLIGHLYHGRGGCGHLRHRGRKVLGIVFHGSGPGPFGRQGGKQHGKHERGHHGNKLNRHGHGHHGKHGHGHHGMQRKNSKGRLCCGCCLGGQEGTSSGQAILGQGDDDAGTAVIPAVEATATQGQGAATQLTSLLETQLVVSERES